MTYLELGKLPGGPELTPCPYPGCLGYLEGGKKATGYSGECPNCGERYCQLHKTPAGHNCKAEPPKVIEPVGNRPARKKSAAKAVEAELAGNAEGDKERAKTLAKYAAD